MDREKLISFLGKDWTDVQSIVSASLHSDIPLLKSANDSILSHPGKQLRPLLALLISRVCNGGSVSRDALLFAAASELLHNATLLHDDVTDESATRRGLPTLWAVFGASPAVLVGDFWLSKAVELVIRSESRDKVVGYFSSTMSDLAEGEMLQLEKSQDGTTSEEDYYRIIRCKTASLFRASIVSAAVASGASREQLSAAESYALSLGMAFQIKDDIMDYCGEDEMGKPGGVDIRERKITLPLLGAIRACPEREEEIRGKISAVREHPEYCDEIREFVFANSGLEYAASCLQDFIGKAESALDCFENSPEKDYLVQIARYNTLRTI